MRVPVRSGTPIALPFDRPVPRGPVPIGGANLSTSQPWRAAPVASASTHTKGAWAQLTAASEADCDQLTIVVRDNYLNATNTAALMDIGIGGAGSEVVIIPNIGAGHYGRRNVFPVPTIPKGTRVACRQQSALANQSANVFVTPMLSTGRRRSPGTPVAVGADTATSRGVTVTVPGATNTKGAWTQITAATDQPFQALGLALQGAGSAALPDADVLVDIGIGASGSETAIIKNVAFFTASFEAVIEVTDLFWPCSIPKGTRLSCRYQSSVVASQSLDAILYGIPA